MQMNAKIGCRTLNDALFEHVLSGAVDPNEAFKKCVAKEEFLRKCQQSEITLASTHDETPAEAPQAAPAAPAASAAAAGAHPRGPLPHAQPRAQPQVPQPTPIPGSRIPSPGQSPLPRR
jgi:hypothetical protein